MINFLRRNELLTVLCVQVAITMLGMGLISPILPQYARGFGVSITMVGLLITVFGVARIIVDIPAANLVEKLGRRPILILGPIIQAIGSVACGLATNYWQLFAFRFVQGAGSAILATAAMIMLADISLPTNRGQVMSLYQGSLLLGSGLGPTIGGFIAQYFGFQAPFFVYAIFAATAAVWAYFRVPETRHMSEEPALPADKVKPSSVDWMASLKLLLRNVNFVTIAIVNFGVFFMRTGSRSQILPLLANDRLGLDPGQIGIAMTIIAAANFAVLLICGRLSDRLGRKIMITPGCLLAAVALVMLSQTDTHWFLILTCVVWGIGTGISGPLPLAYMVDITPKENYSSSMGIYRTIGDLGFVAGPIILGWLSDIQGYSFALLVNSALLFLAIIIFQVFAREPSHLNK